MKRMIRLIVLLPIFLCIACGPGDRQDIVEQTENIVAESQQEMIESFHPVNETLVANQKENKGFNCLVQVKTDNQQGSGVLWDKQEAFWTIVTAAHVVEGLEQAEVYFEASGQMCVAHVYSVEGLDLAFLQMEVNLITEETAGYYEECTPIPEEVKEDEMISAIGYNAFDERLEQEGTILEGWIYTEAFDNYMLLCECEAQAGMSGGGVFTKKGALAGIICGANEEGLLAVLPAGVIMSEYALFINY